MLLDNNSVYFHGSSLGRICNWRSHRDSTIDWECRIRIKLILAETTLYMDYSPSVEWISSCSNSRCRRAPWNVTVDCSSWWRMQVHSRGSWFTIPVYDRVMESCRDHFSRWLQLLGVRVVLNARFFPSLMVQGKKHYEEQSSCLLFSIYIEGLA